MVLESRGEGKAEKHFIVFELMHIKSFWVFFGCKWSSVLRECDYLQKLKEERRKTMKLIVIDDERKVRILQK